MCWILQYLFVRFRQVWWRSDPLAYIEFAHRERIVKDCRSTCWASQEKQNIQHEVSYFVFMKLFIVYGCLRLKVRKQTSKGIDTEHVKSFTTSIEKTLILPTEQLSSVRLQDLSVKITRIEVQRQDCFIQDAIEPKCIFFLENDFQNPCHDTWLALTVDKCPIALLVCLQDFEEPFLHHGLSECVG